MKNNPHALWRIYGISWILTALILISVAIWGSTADLIKVTVLACLEVTFSFDNAIVNAKILSSMSLYWQKLFMTVGIVIAVFGVRVLFPVLLVTFTTGQSIANVTDLVLHDPVQYAHHLEKAHPMIASFGGIFLLLLFLDFILEDRVIRWLKPLEDMLAKLGKLENISVLIAVMSLLFISSKAGEEDQQAVLIAGLLGALMYLAINAVDTYFAQKDKAALKAGANIARAGLIGFLYLEMIDASFSLDGVVGAFAVTSKVLLIALGLGIGALYVRSMTVHVMRRGTLSKYQYLEHGAHYAIGALAVLMLASVSFKIPEMVGGLVGIVIIGCALTSSIVAKRSVSN